MGIQLQRRDLLPPPNKVQPSKIRSMKPMGSGRTLKRPVASDFDNYTPRFEPPKRTRTDERLVIDVSDDEDVEMDMGSPTDEHPPSADSNAAPTRQSLGTFPPLSDGPNRRQRESPASSSAPTPPVHGARIDLLHKRIEETKRLIAEAEAKKAAKKATTQPSPRPLSPAAQQPSNSPKINSSNFERKRAVSLRRDRIASYELPRLTAALREKQDRLKLLFTEAARLELEVQESLDEQRKLTMEMDGLVEPSTTLSPETGEQQPQTRDGKYSGLEVQQPALPARPHAVSPHAGQGAAPNDHQDPQEELPSEPQVSHSQKTPSANVNGDAGTVPRNYEELRPAVFTETAHIMDIQMADVDASAPADDNTPVVSGVVAVSISPKSIETSSLAESSEAQVEKNRRGTSEGISTNTAAEIDSLIKSPIPSSEPDVESSLSDVSMQQSVAELSQSDDEFYEPTPAQISNSHGAHKAEHNNTEVVDDILEEPNPNHTSADGDYQEPEDTSNEVAQGTKPPLEDLLSYKSPLSYFRAYRFHPKYFDQVPGGLKSMTFSARIDPMRQLCPYALAGEACPKGPSCEYQHFDSMVLPDGEIITQLGSADMFVGETRTRFIEGLKRVLNELKANRVKDFDRITRAIVKHRQEFLGDKSKVLALDSSAP
ncbi:hypothetical protein NUW58_g8706 [Xylaria curta]|uniref:Uncharacterized protein n=1 Tax=Xylaria curta TaxID=42375 RepID=A0ACC1N746_9PEZI|nr:hypothetical protein NUW58_g8706 [Xylaria curta]